MPLTEEQKQTLDIGILPRQQRLHLLSHVEIEQEFSKALETLFGGHYSVHIKSWGENGDQIFKEKIEITATISSYTPEGDQ
jgi:hypothetical protein